MNSTLTFRELRDRLNTLSEEELNRPVVLLYHVHPDASSLDEEERVVAGQLSIKDAWTDAFDSGEGVIEDYYGVAEQSCWNQVLCRGQKFLSVDGADISMSRSEIDTWWG